MADRAQVLPYGYEPRDYQMDLWSATLGSEEGEPSFSRYRRFDVCAHRRWGKDLFWLNRTIIAAVEQPGIYWHMLPSYSQARKVVWRGKNSLTGRGLLDYWPPELVARQREDDMLIETTTGSSWQLIGGDNYNSYVGSAPRGVVFSEWALTDPDAWNFVRPILAENGGWAVFIYTPRGRNHAYQMRQRRLKNARWFNLLQTVHDTKAISEEAIQADRDDGMSEAMIQQEYYCSFEGVQQGAYFGAPMAQAEKDRRIGRVPYQSEIAVDTWWDLGIGDAMAIWFTQNVGREVHVIDYLEHSGEGFPWYARALQDRGYVYGTHNAPHDIQVRELGSGKSRLETAAALGIRFHIVPRLDIADGIDAARALIARCWFDAAKTERGRFALVSYHKTWDEKRKCFGSHPFHDWSSNGADAFRYLAVGHKTTTPRLRKQEPIYRIAGGSGDHSWMGT